MQETHLAGLTPVSDPELIAILEQPQRSINQGGVGGGGVGAAMTANKRGELRDSLTALGQFEADLQRLEASFYDNFKDQGFATPLEYLPGEVRPVNQDYNAASMRMLPLVAKALGYTAKQMDTPAEIERLKAYVPSSTDTDLAASTKIENLRNMLNRQRANLNSQLGNAPDSAEETTPPRPASPVEASATGEMAFSTDRDKAFAAEAQAMFDRGASRVELDQFAVQQGYLPYGADLDAAIDYRRQGGKGARVAAPESGYRGPSTIGALAATPVGSFFAGAGNALTGGLLDEIVGATGGDAEQAQAAKEVMRAANPLSSLAGEVMGAGLSMAGLSRVPGLAVRTTPLAREMAYGATYGAGESNDDRLGGAAVGAGAALAGDMLVRGVRGLGRRYQARRDTPERQAGREVAQASERQGVSVMPADVGGTMVRRLTGAAAQGPVSAVPIIRKARAVTEEAQAARDRIAASIGAALDAEGAGQAARAGAKAFIGRTSARARTLYKQAETLARGAEMPLAKAKDTIDRNIAELEGVPGGAEGLAALKALRDEMSGQFTVQGIRGMRTQLRDRFISTGLRGSDLERRVNQVIEAANDDIADGLVSAGKLDAASAYRAADRYWRARVRTIDTALEPIIGAAGEKSGEEIMQGLNRAGKGNAARLAAFVRALPDEEQAMVRSTFISQLGRSSAGTQNAAGDAFSLPQFLTHWNQLTPGAKATLFTGESRAALNDLARIAEGAREAQRFQNFSNTAGGVAGQILLGGGGYSLGGLPGMVGGLLTQYGAGTLLASPRFARWLARAPRNAADPHPYIDRLQRIAAAEAPIAAEVSGLRQALLGAVNDNAVTSAAASADADRDQ